MTAQVTDPAPAFDVASIRPSPPSTDGHHHIYSSPNESHFRTGNLSTKDLIQFAYDMPVSQILGGPPWLDTVFFDIDAKSDPAADDRMHGLTSEAGKLQKRLMVQALLADRFGLKAHMETRELPNYTLVVANPKTGPNLHLTHANGTTIDTGNEHIHVMGGGDNTVPLTNNANSADDWYWYFLMQHYGCPTRLLDWTTSPLVALYFAVRNPNELDAAVWVIDPWRWNRAHVKDLYGPAIPGWKEAKPYLLKLEDAFDSDLEGKQTSMKWPMAIEPSHIDRRIAAQGS